LLQHSPHVKKMKKVAFAVADDSISAQKYASKEQLSPTHFMFSGQLIRKNKAFLK
jgi:hypothetical protein